MVRAEVGFAEAHHIVALKQVSADEYQRITHDYALAAARAFANLSPGMRFLHLSGEGADTTEKSRIRFGRVKGATENALLALGKPEVRKIKSCTR